MTILLLKPVHNILQHDYWVSIVVQIDDKISVHCGEKSDCSQALISWAHTHC